MGKTIVALLLIAGAAYFVYQKVGQTPSEEVQLVEHLGERFEAVVSKFSSAQSRAGLIGESIFDAAATADLARKIRTELAELRARLTEGRAIRKADVLSEKVERFCQKNDII
jgi:hypothetical protein